VPKDRRRVRKIHCLDADGMLACNPRDREAAHRAAVGDIAIGEPKEVTCRKCSERMSKRIQNVEQCDRK